MTTRISLYCLMSAVLPILGLPVLSAAPDDRLVQLSTRVSVKTGDGAAIAGFIVSGTGVKKVCVRGLGPSLGTAGVAGALQDPTLELYDSNGKLLVTDDNWKQNGQANALRNAGLAPKNDAESAIITTLAAGTSYTVVLRGADEQVGVGLVEVYDLDEKNETASKLANLSTRGDVGKGSDVMIGGFITQGNNPSSIVVRAEGPSLSANGHGIAGALRNPALELYDAQGNMLAQNDDWSAGGAAEISAMGLAPSNRLEPAILRTLQAGSYTVVVKSVDSTTGISLLEIYDATAPLASNTSDHAIRAASLLVDAKGGNDATGARGTADHPFATVAAAISHSQAGDIIGVRPGVYSFDLQVITVPNLVITAEGATFRKKSPVGSANLFTVLAPGFVVHGATFDGNRRTEIGGAFRNYLLLFQGGADNAVVDECRFLNNAGSALGVCGKIDNVVIQNNYFEHNFNDIWSASDNSDVVTNLQITDNTFAGNINSAQFSGAIKLHSTVQYRASHIIARNQIRGPGEMGFEIQGDAEGSQITQNSVDGTVFGISVDTAGGTSVKNNGVKGCIYRGIEFAQAIGCKAESNTIDGTNDSGAVVTREGYGISNGAFGNTELNLQISGGTVLDCVQPVKVIDQSGISLTNLTMRATGPYGITFMDCNNSSISNSSITHPGDTNGPIFVQVSDGNTVHNLSFVNLQIHTAGDSIYQLFTLYGSTGRINDFLVEGVDTNATFFNSGVITGAELINHGELKCINNSPSTASENSQYGFPSGGS